MSRERELNDIAEVLRILTTAYIENKTKCISETYRYAYRTAAEFGMSVSCLASTKAYDDFYGKTGKDIRDFKRDERVKDRAGKAFVVHQEYMYEHFIPASQFRDCLIALYEDDKLTIENIKLLITKQNMCWITKGEDKKLTELGYRSKRTDSEKAYFEAGITIKH